MISLFVTGLLAWVVMRYNRKSEPNILRTFTHNSPLEVAWTVVPIVILVVHRRMVVARPVQAAGNPRRPIITIKVTGYQWYWGYEYVDEGVAFEGYMIGYGEGNMNPDSKVQLEEAGYSRR